MTPRFPDRSLEADVVRTFECGNAASKRPPSRSPLDGIDSDGPWVEAVAAFADRHPRRHDRLDAYRALLESGAHRAVGADVLAGRHRPAPPVEAWVNKADGRKKRVFRYPPTDELLFRVANRALQPAAAEAASPWCRSFLPGGGARAAFRTVTTGGDLAAMSSLRLDVRDYFNSIDVVDLLAGLPPALGSAPVAGLISAALLDRRVARPDGSVVDGGAKGVMAGTPLAPLLATLYLRDLDHEVAATGATYARYSDDIVVLAPPGAIEGVAGLVRHRLAERGLEVNEAKSALAAPGEPWDFLGFRYHQGTIGLAPITERKLKARATRLARALLRWRERSGAAPERALAAFVRRTNRRIYGIPAERSDFSWATWFLPMLAGPGGLAALDDHLRREARYAATGIRTGRAHRLVPYAALAEVGHLPLVPAYWAMQAGAPAYEALVTRRTGLAPAAP